MKTLVLLLFFVSSVWADELHNGECLPSEETHEQLRDVTISVLDNLRKQKISTAFCEELKKCYADQSEPGYLSPDQHCSYFDYRDVQYKNSEDLQENVSTPWHQHRNTCGMNHQELSGVYHYMASLYLCLNRDLYGGTGSNYPTLISAINEGLLKLPAYKGFVFRGSNLPKAILEQHREGEIVRYKAFTSTSTNYRTGEIFSEGENGNEGQLFLIYSSSGRPVMGIESAEKEVLFKSGTQFKVLKVNGNRFIMRETVAGETPSQSKSEDERILALAENARNNSVDNPDMWKCPADPHHMPKELIQINVPGTAKFLSSPASQASPARRAE